MRVRTGVFVSLMTAAMLATMLAPLVRAYIPEPYELFGVARDASTIVLADGSPIRSFVDGVEYSNETSVFSRPGQNDGYFDIDTYGNWRTNLMDPGTPWIKEGGDLNESIMYTYGDFSNNTQIGGPAAPWLTGKVFKESHLWLTGLPPQAGDLNLPADAVQPPPLKIYSVTTHSLISPSTDYVWLCNPTNTPVEGSDFYLQKDIPGDFLGPSVQVPAGLIPAFTRKFVDTNSLDYFVETGDNLKLVWTNDGGPTGAFGGNDIIVDRVEFNLTGGGGTLNWEPGNTIMSDAPAPGPGWQINRSAACGDTNGKQTDFWLDLEIRPNDPPLAPDPICLQGLCSDNIDSRLFHITVLTNFPINWTHHDNNSDPQGAANVYISTLPNGVNKIWTLPVVGPTQSAMYTGLPLLAGNNYCLGVQTRDASSWGPYAEMCFRTNGLPPPVNRLAPPQGATLLTPSTSQRVWWTNMSDPDPGDLVNYSWAVSLNSNMGSPFATGVTTSNFSAPFTTVQETTYYWCVNETDGWGWVNQCNSPWQFTTGSPPQEPYANNLKIATYDSTNPARLRLINRVNPLLDWDFNPGAPRSQTGFEVEVRISDDTLFWTFTNTGVGGDLTQVTYAGPTFVNGTCYYFQVKVRDNLVPQMWSTSFSTPLDFCINIPPSVPSPLAPADDSVRLPGSAIIWWSISTDGADGDTITYDYCVGPSDPPTPACNVASGQPSLNNSNAFTTTDGGNYYWVVRAYDTHEYSGYSTVWNFTAKLVTNNNPTITIQTPTLNERLKQGQQYTITWTMNDIEDLNSVLTVLLAYSVGGGTPIPIFVVPLTGATSYQWTVPSNVESTAVTITAVVVDTDGGMGTDVSDPFEIYKPAPEPGFPIIWVLLIVIIVVVLVLVLLLLMKRKKPKEEEAAPAAAEEPVEEAPAEEEIEEEVAPPPKAAPKPVAAAAPTKTPAKTKECPSCGTIVSVTDKECFMCGAKL